MKKFAFALALILGLQARLFASLPVITTQPASQTVSLGVTNIVLSVIASNATSYQWNMANCANAGPLVGGTNASFTIASIQGQDLGDYFAVVANATDAVTSSVATISASCAYTPCGIKAWWGLTNGAADYAGGFTGTMKSGVTFVANGKVGSGFKFDGTTNALIACGTTVGNFGTNDFSVEFWENVPVGTGFQSFVGNDPNSLTGNCWQVGLGWITGWSNLYFLVYNYNNGGDFVAVTNNVTDGGWHHIACTRSNVLGAGNAVISIYIDGTIVTSKTIAIINPNQTTWGLRLGSDAYLQSYLPNNSMMDEVALYSRALSGLEISNVFAAGTNGKCCVDPVISVPASDPSGITKSSSTAKFTNKFNGTGITYQWTKNGTNLTNGVGHTLSGATNTLSWPSNAVLSISPIDSSDIGSYALVLSNACNTIVSDAAYLTAPSWNVNGQPASQTASVGANPVFTASASGTKALVYKWYLNGSQISGATSSSYTVSNVSDAMEGNSYTVVITNTLSGNYTLAITSAPALLSVVATVQSITKTPSSGVSCDGGNVTISVTADGPGTLSYQWRRNGTDIPNATLSTFPTNAAGSYSVVVSNGHGSDTSSAAVITLNNYPVFTSQPASQTVNVGSSAIFAVTSTGTGRTFQWYGNGGLIAGATKSSYTLNNPQLLDAGGYYVTISNVCTTPGAASSASATLSVNDVPLLLFSNKLDGALVDAWSFEGNTSNSINPSDKYSLGAGAYYTNGYQGLGIVPSTDWTWLTNSAAVGTSDFAIDFWFSLSGISVFGDFFETGGPDEWFFTFSCSNLGSNYLYLVVGTGDEQHRWGAGEQWFDNGFHHVVLTRTQGINFSLSFDDVVSSFTTDRILSYNLAPLAIEHDSPPDLVIDQLRISCGIPWKAVGGQIPSRYTNSFTIENTNRFGSPVSLLLDTTNNSPALVAFSTLATNKAPNIDCAQGTVRFWFQPSWNTGDLAAPTNGMFVNVGTNAPTNGWWGLGLTNNGSTIVLNTRTNDGTTTFSAQDLLVTNLTFYSTNWYQIALTFDSNSTALFTNGVLAGTGSGIAYYPSFSERTNGGFSIGSDLSGFNQARGQFDQIDIYNFVQDTNWIYTNYQALVSP